MDVNNVIRQATAKFGLAVSHFEEELKTIRTGRAHPSILDGIMVEAYGTPMPLVQVASVSAPEGQLLQITPYDPGNLGAIAAAIRQNQSLGLNPMDDGKVVRVPIPPLTEERRREYVKLVGSKAEDAMISLRNVRHDGLSTIDKAKKDKEIGEDEAKRLTDQVEAAMNDAKTSVESLSKQKEQEILTV